MNDIHDPAGCRQPACQRCEDYEQAIMRRARIRLGSSSGITCAKPTRIDCQCAPCTTSAQATAGLVTLLLQVAQRGRRLHAGAEAVSLP